MWRGCYVDPKPEYTARPPSAITSETNQAMPAYLGGVDEMPVSTVSKVWTFVTTVFVTTVRHRD